MKKAFLGGIGTLVVGGGLMGLSYNGSFGSSVSADSNIDLAQSTALMGTLFVVGAILILISIALFLFAASTSEKK